MAIYIFFFFFFFFFTSLDEILKVIYFILCSEMNAYLKQIKMVSITGEIIPYHFTSD